jgi:hypothetical protein
MQVAEHMATAAAGLARLLLVLAVVTTALNVHPAHAHPPGDPAAHGHIDSACALSESEPASGGQSLPRSGQADCTHQFFPMVRLSALALSAFASEAVAGGYATLTRQLFDTFDPPPPRLPA